ncbi:hypothetical protein [Rhizobium sp. AG207R]|uniref:hypothetical protein n=1 Tax=Rhizobium sp. AG207R TaxID=2802287 RepID=UPI0013B0307F|nr:hypothetical protein [Rhizobium sp. AG207R]
MQRDTMRDCCKILLLQFQGVKYGMQGVGGRFASTICAQNPLCFHHQRDFGAAWMSILAARFAPMPG